jgi:hypothetical protein
MVAGMMHDTTRIDDDPMDRSTTSFVTKTGDEESMGTKQDNSISTKEGKNANAKNDEEQGMNGLAKNETHSVKQLRFIVAMVLVLSTVSIALTIYFFVRNSERSNFHEGYTSDAHRVLDGMGMSIHDSISAMSSFSTMMIAFARQSNQSFPYFTMPNFGVKASKLLTQTAGFSITVQTVITSDQRLTWEAYSMQKEGWVNETKQVQEMDQFYYNEVSYGAPNRAILFNYTHDLPYDIPKYVEQ